MVWLSRLGRSDCLVCPNECIPILQAIAKTHDLACPSFSFFPVYCLICFEFHQQSTFFPLSQGHFVFIPTPSVLGHPKGVPIKNGINLEAICPFPPYRCRESKVSVCLREKFSSFRKAFLSLWFDIWEKSPKRKESILLALARWVVGKGKNN